MLNAQCLTDEPDWRTLSELLSMTTNDIKQAYVIELITC